MLPPPTLSFTIPSIHDGLELQCRIYHPSCLTPTTITQATKWREQAAIVAHPYAPLGGCYDDPVVERIASTLLDEWFIVGTFNFRGAGTAKGRTSWQSIPEQNDYISFIGFMVYYIYHLQPPRLPLEHDSLDPNDPDAEFYALSPIHSQVVPPAKPRLEYLMESPAPQTLNTPPLLLLSGYSYGALIATSLPPILSSTISPFQTPASGSPYAEIRMRAASLADQQNESMHERFSRLSPSSPRGRRSHSEGQASASSRSHTADRSVRVGGLEDLRNSSHESYVPRSSSFPLESPVRKSVDRVRSIARSGAFGHRRQASHSSVASSKKGTTRSSSSLDQARVVEKETLEAIPDITQGLKVAYLLVSPLHGWTNSLLTMSLPLRGLKTVPWRSRRESDNIPEHEMKLTIDPTLAIFGDDDVFVSVHKLRAWAEKLSSACEERGHRMFKYKEVANAGHFWHDSDALRVLREEVAAFIVSL